MHPFDCNPAGVQVPCEVMGLRSCDPKFWVPNTFMEGHVGWFRDPKPKGTNPKGTKGNSLSLGV